MPTAHLIFGYLGAGKTRFARALEQRLPGIRFSHDEWMVRLFGEDPPAEHFAEYHRLVSAQIAAVWPRCLQLGLDVVLDLAFWSRQQRDETRRQVAELGADCRLYHLHCPEHLAWQRIAARNNDLDGSLRILRATFDALKPRFEALAADEARIEIDSQRPAVDP